MSTEPASRTENEPRHRPRIAGFHLGELRLVLGSGLVYALRMLGVYMATPVLSPYVQDLPGSTPVWVGLSLGAYGLTQAIFQIPFGILGDRIGRLRSLWLALAIFAGGSFVCAAATTAPMLVLGRFIQGIAAMASSMIAMLGDYTRDVIRTRAMAALGILIGLAFSMGLVFGPVVAASQGVPWLFSLSGYLSLAGLLVLPWAVHGFGRKAHPKPQTLPKVPLRRAFRILTKPQLLALDVGILVLHLGLTSLFVCLPLQIEPLLPAQRQWIVYAPAIIAGLVALGVSSHVAEKTLGARIVLVAGGLLLGTGFLSFANADSLVAMIVSLIFYVMGFASMEPALAAQVTRHAHTLVRGTAAGIFNTVQFFGVFLGGLLSGLALEHDVVPLYFTLIAAAQIPWLLYAWRIPRTRRSRRNLVSAHD